MIDRIFSHLFQMTPQRSSWHISPCSLLALLSIAFSFLSSPTILLNASGSARDVRSKRAEPTTGVDLPDTDNHPNKLDQVEAVFNNSLELGLYASLQVDADTTIFPSYFHEGDRAGVKKVFLAILGDGVPQAPVGNDLLGSIHVQVLDTSNMCNGDTLAYSHEVDEAYIILCPDMFKKKAVTALNGHHIQSKIQPMPNDIYPVTSWVAMATIV